MRPCIMQCQGGISHTAVSKTFLRRICSTTKAWHALLTWKKSSSAAQCISLPFLHHNLPDLLFVPDPHTLWYELLSLNRIAQSMATTSDQGLHRDIVTLSHLEGCWRCFKDIVWAKTLLEDASTAPFDVVDKWEDFGKTLPPLTMR